MSEITAAMVKELRAATGAGMMECKKALGECSGDFDKAVDFLRVKSGAKAERVAGRAASEGRLGFGYVGSTGVLAEINCETDFVSRGVQFGEFCNHIAMALASKSATNAEKSSLADGRSGEEARLELVMQVGENVNFGRVSLLSAKGNITHYMHTGDKIAAMIDYEGEEETAREICMHIAAMRPTYLSMDDVPADAVERERGVLTAQAAESGKSPEVIEKMIEGRLKKHFAERVLLLQPFVKNDEKNIDAILKESGLKVHGFCLLVVGA